MHKLPKKALRKVPSGWKVVAVENNRIYKNDNTWYVKCTLRDEESNKEESRHVERSEIRRSAPNLLGPLPEE